MSEDEYNDLAFKIYKIFDLDDDRKEFIFSAKSGVINRNKLEEELKTYQRNLIISCNQIFDHESGRLIEDDSCFIVTTEEDA